MNKTQVKTALIPHNNDQMEIKFLQSRYPGIHFAPFYFFSKENFESIPLKVSLNPDFTLTGRIWNLSVTAVFEDCERTLFLPFLKTHEKPEPHDLNLSLKVFQIAEIEVTETGPVTEYRILKSKWTKAIPNP